jgi:chromosome segregation ATPase
LLKYDDLKRPDWLEGPTRYAIDAFIRGLSDAAERTLTDAQRARLNKQREEAYRNRFDDDARPGLLKHAMQSLLKPAVLRRLEAAQSDLDALYEAVNPIETLVAEYNARQPEPVDAAFDAAVRIARQRLDEETARQQEAWRDRQPLPEDLAWLALQLPDVIAEARALNDAEDAAERKAAQEAERERLADEAATKLANRIEALRAGFAASVADWKAARADNASRVAAHEEELDELHARLRELAGPVKAALSGEPDAAAVSRGEDALREIQDLVDEARAILEPPPSSNDYGWSPFEP